MGMKNTMLLGGIPLKQTRGKRSKPKPEPPDELPADAAGQSLAAELFTAMCEQDMMRIALAQSRAVEEATAAIAAAGKRMKQAADLLSKATAKVQGRRSGK